MKNFKKNNIEVKLNNVYERDCINVSNNLLNDVRLVESFLLLKTEFSNFI